MQLGPLRLGILHERSRTIVPTAGGVTHVPGLDPQESLFIELLGYGFCVSAARLLPR